MRQIEEEEYSIVRKGIGVDQKGQNIAIDLPEEY